jgi:hypothetical protein
VNARGVPVRESDLTGTQGARLIAFLMRAMAAAPTARVVRLI